MWPIWASCFGTRRISRTLWHISGHFLPYDSPWSSCGYSTSDIHSAYSVTGLVLRLGRHPRGTSRRAHAGDHFGPGRLPVEDRTAYVDDRTLTYTSSDFYTKKGFPHFKMSANSGRLVDAAYLNSHWAVQPLRDCASSCQYEQVSPLGPPQKQGHTKTLLSKFRLSTPPLMHQLRAAVKKTTLSMI